MPHQITRAWCRDGVAECGGSAGSKQASGKMLKHLLSLLSVAAVTYADGQSDKARLDPAVAAGAGMLPSLYVHALLFHARVPAMLACLTGNITATRDGSIRTFSRRR